MSNFANVIKYGKQAKYPTPELLWTEFKKYIEWCHNNPLEDHVVFANGEETYKKKVRLVTLNGFCLFAGISKENFQRYRSGEHGDKKFIEVTTNIGITVDEIRGDYAAADMHNANFVAKIMGLVDKVENINYNSVQLTPEQIKEINKQLDDEV